MRKRLGEEGGEEVLGRGACWCALTVPAALLSVEASNSKAVLCVSAVV